MLIVGGMVVVWYHYYRIQEEAFLLPKDTCIGCFLA
jgi:hypothetical protein